jgi:hypothetical protein
MIYSGDLIKIDGTVIPHIKHFKVQRAKLWKSSDRNMAGDVRATLIGIFPKITLKIRQLNQSEMSALTQIFDKDFFEVEWFDVRTQTTHTATYYAGDYDTSLFNRRKGLYDEFDISLIPVSRRRYE